MLGEITRLKNFETAHELAAFVGLTPKRQV
ncbi:MAG: transposase [Alphaproteobacteria bacterium]|nr:transposase [Alphaproteobacteria bacterium]